MANEDLDGVLSPDEAENLLPSRTTEEIVQALVDSKPKHNITLAQRIAQMTALAKRDNEPDDYQRIYELRVEQIGGDPDEMMGGNRPRYTMDEDMTIKDHETGEMHHVLREDNGAPDDGSQESIEVVVTYTPSDPRDDCEHIWHDPVEAETPCSKCGLKFGEWAVA